MFRGALRRLACRVSVHLHVVSGIRRLSTIDEKLGTAAKFRLGACDPFEQGGSCLPPKFVAMLHKSVKEWKVNKESTKLTRTFTLASVDLLNAFAAKIYKIGENLDHPPHSVVLRSSELAAEVTLYTPKLEGLSYRDFQMALMIPYLGELKGKSCGPACDPVSSTSTSGPTESSQPTTSPAP
ncbi:4a-hydroxytetrahydrobiopterin dehydratase [Plasmodiophora brassicae]|uniref:4a-hydroxytetrahydrobiopterin dehydratase n=1 Tax=Plasmodiophora brassicae TaxID=37360 RepID=A0A3P3Y8R0_PLABS|nr:unnamed protein product [Plasmodiophora brassicae]